MASPQEAPDRARSQAGMERLLGLPEGHHSVVLPLRLEGRPLRGSRTEAPHHSGWSHHAADTGTS